MVDAARRRWPAIRGWTRARGWIPITAVVLAALGGVVAPARAAACEDEAAYRQAVVSPSDTGGDPPAVGIAIHIMERPGKRCEVRKRWTAAKIAALFGSTAGDRRSVNSIWSPVGIRFALRDIRVHEFSAARGMTAKERIKVPLQGPRGDPAFEDAFAALVTRFHRDRHVNVYLWTRLDGGPVGFGRSTRTGEGKATVFLDSHCAGLSRRACATLAAHELGHTLGLYHAGPGTCGRVDQKFRGLCQFLAARCDQIPIGERLMVLGGTERRLCRREIDEAVEMAEREFR